MKRPTKSLHAIGLSALHNRAVAKYLERRILDRAELLADGHPAVIEVQEFGGESTVEYPEPPHIGDLPRVIADRPEFVKTPPATACVCRDVQLVGPDGITFLPGGKVLAENSLGWSTRIAVSSLKTIARGKLPTRGGNPSETLECAVSLVAPWATNYYHWIADHLLRLEALEDYIQRTGVDPMILVPPDASQWMIDLLVYLGYDESKVKRFDGERTRVERLLVPFLPRETAATAPEIEYLCYTTRPAALEWFGKRVRSRTAGVTCVNSGTRGVYVSRQGMTVRKVSNLAAIEPVLENHGIQIVCPEMLSIAEQVALFASTEIIVGPHGAGLTNMIFGDDAKVVELFGAHHHPVFYAMATQIKSGYVCAEFQESRDGIRVDPDELDRALCIADE